jgi:hypothetical protein
LRENYETFLPRVVVGLLFAFAIAGSRTGRSKTENMRDQREVKKEKRREESAESTVDQIAQSEFGSTTPSEARKIFFPPPP